MKRLAVLLALVMGVAGLSAPPAQAAGKELRFSILCDLSHTAQVDPIVSPGQTSAHLHEFFGNEHTDEHQHSPRFMRKQGTTCDFSGDTAGYWVPALRSPSGERIPALQVLVYYRNPRGEPVRPHPADFMAVSQEATWHCLDSQEFAEPVNCDTDANKHREIALRVVFGPETINGKLTPRIALNVRYDIKDARGAYLDTHVEPHGDFWNVWVQRKYAALVHRCLDPSGPWAGYSAAEWEARCVKVTDESFAIGD